MSNPTHVDDRCNAFVVYDPAKGDHWAKEELARDSGRAELSMRLVSATSQAVPRGLRIAFVAALIVLCGVGGMLGGLTLRRYGFPGWIVPIVLSTTSVALFRFLTRRRRQAVVVKALLAERRCASCAYLLDQLSPAADGCVVCPECGAAWAQSRLGVAAAPPAGWSRRSAAGLPGARLAPATVADVNGRLFVIAPAQRWQCDDGARRRVRRATLARRTLSILMLCIPFGMSLTLVLLSPSFRALPALNTAMGWLKLLGLAFIGYSVLLMPLLMWRTWLGRTSSLAQPTGRAMVKEGICPGCGSALSTAGHAAGGVVACGGCPGVWAMNPESPRQIGSGAGAGPTI